jgi:4-hydroxy-tetrahydrodipicolinate synthase
MLRSLGVGLHGSCSSRRLFSSRPWRQLPAAIRAPPLHGVRAIGAEGALEAADSRVTGVGRQARRTALAFSAHFERHPLSPFVNRRRLAAPVAAPVLSHIIEWKRKMSAIRERIRGSMPALITPFRDGKIDEAALRRLVNWQIDQGSHGLVPCGTTGESPTLSNDEIRRVVEIVVDEARGRVPVVAGAGSNCTAHAIELTKIVKAAGADAALSVTGYYNKPSQEGLYRHYAAIADAVDIPLIVYNIPGRAVVEITVETMARLSKLKTVIGVKDATTNLARPLRERTACGREWRMISGEDSTTLGYMVQGGHGCISVTANVAPKLCADFQNACMQGAWDTALALQERLMPLHDAMFVEPSPAPVKYAGSLLGICSDEVRLPLAPASDAARAKVREAMQSAGISK